MSELVIDYPSVRRGRRVVLQANTLHLALPAALAVVGVNGSGKTSLFMCLADILAARPAGRLEFEGRRAGVAYVPQIAALPHWLTAAACARMYGLELSTLHAAMPRLYLDELHGHTAGQLSAGQRQALAVGIALGRDADLTLLDEPLSALDFRRRAGVIEALKERAALDGRGVILSSPSAADLRDVCSHYLVLRDGRSVFEGSRAALTGGDPDAAAVERHLLELLG